MGGRASALVGALCWIKVFLGLTGPLSVDSPLPYRTLVLVLVPLGLGAWLRGLTNLPTGKSKSLARWGLGIAWLGIAYVVVVGLEQYFLHVIDFSIPWAGSGYMLLLLGLLLVGISVLLSKVLPVWSRALPLILGLPLPLLMLVKIPRDSGVLWMSVTLAVGAGFVVLGWVLGRVSTSAREA